MKASKGKQTHFYFTLKSDGLGGNSNPRLRPRIRTNEIDRQNNICREILYLVLVWDRSSARGGT